MSCYRAILHSTQGYLIVNERGIVEVWYGTINSAIDKETSIYQAKSHSKLTRPCTVALAVCMQDRWLSRMEQNGKWCSPNLAVQPFGLVWMEPRQQRGK